MSLYTQTSLISLFDQSVYQITAISGTAIEKIPNLSRRRLLKTSNIFSRARHESEGDGRQSGLNVAVGDLREPV